MKRKQKEVYGMKKAIIIVSIAVAVVAAIVTCVVKVKKLFDALDIDFEDMPDFISEY